LSSSISFSLSQSPLGFVFLPAETFPVQAHFRRCGIELNWALYADYDALVEAFVKRKVDLAWNAPLAYVKIKRRLQNPC